MRNQPIDWRTGIIVAIIVFAVMHIVGSWDAEIDQAYRDSRNCEFRGACK